MNEKTLTKISIVGVSISLVILYVITSQVFSLHVDIGDIDKSFIGKTVNITGEITGISESQNHMFLDLMDDTGSIKIVLWQDTLELVELNNVNISDLKKGNKIDVVGDVQLYMGELEVIPIRGNVKIL